MRSLAIASALLALSLSIALAACAASRDGLPIAAMAPMPLPMPTAPKPVDLEGLHNVVAYTGSLLSGSQPEGRGLEVLAAMGIRTIVSVDGAQPDVEAAKALGLRYVHLPIGYDGIDADRKLELARAVRDLPGPIYVHCHHGKHRSAGAAAAVAVALGQLSNEQALARMKVSGTAPSYKGLYACATDTKVASPQQIDAASNAFPSRWKTTGLVQGMVEIDLAMEHLKEVEKAGFVTPKEHPDLVPAAEVGRIAHILRELRDDPETKGRGTDFLQRIDSSMSASDALEKSFLDEAPKDRLAADLKLLNQSCKDCHVKYRDNLK